MYLLFSPISFHNASLILQAWKTTMAERVATVARALSGHCSKPEAKGKYFQVKQTLMFDFTLPDYLK